MSRGPVEINNLPIDASRRYADDQRKLEESRPIIEESWLFPGKPGEAVPAAPYIPAENVEWLALGSRTTWAAFPRPPDYAVHVDKLFSYLLIPSLGSSENLQAISDKLESLAKEIPQDKVPQHEYKTLGAFINDPLIDLTRTHESIKGRCNQYQKG